MSRLRNYSREVALASAYGAIVISGQKKRLEKKPGASILLLHETIGKDALELIDFVKVNREQFVDFRDAIPSLDHTPKSSIAITFDDGFKSNLAIGRALANMELSACFYVPTDIIGENKSASDEFFRRPQAEGVMSWADLEELASLGHVIGSHCKQHKALSSMSRAEAEDQVMGSIDVLRNKLGRADHFAWPFGSLSHAPVEDVVRWCRDSGAVPASGVRGANTAERYASEGYIRRDAVSLKSIKRDFTVFSSRDALTRR